ncbi:Deoxyribodipyrimidine photo-lyase [Rubrivivax sp. A210]|uniref:cryptochrome/photolyase family protein n=1 Tax=Rubrivivax sp. A210 TaxID=2772301 RepID=UPI0019185F31|nr:deoxyribodipyrimidine photo-lyase [Rubrivivax sp. A210]CAD5372686.1 Deoxyribodipyrimidine photo-lyase [Rubrivivax sp. A210]
MSKTPSKPAGKPLDRALVWLRRDLRADDHAALYHALRAARRVWCAFVFDRDILDPLLAAGRQADRRVEFIRDSLLGVDAELRALAASHGVEGVSLLVRHGRAHEEITALATRLSVQAVYANHDDEPAALARDARVRGLLAEQGVALHTSKDVVVFERSEVLTQGGGAFSVFTPYKNAWLKKLVPFYLKAYPVAHHAAALAPAPSSSLPSGVPALESLGFARTNLHQLRLPTGPAGGHELFDDFLQRIDGYHETRDYPAVKGPSYLSTHLRFGTVSIRRLAREAAQRREGGSRGAEVWLSELIWRDFYHQILAHHPRVVGESFKPEYERIRWEHGKQADALFAAWCEGRTGYPLVDAAMRQLAQTGYMHNRLRMVVACFLCKDLGLDWRRGEAFFALHLNDYDLAANNGGWQWAASCGCDAQPYFRIFNPVTQSEKFDPEGRFIRRYLPQLAALPAALIHAPWTARPVDLAALGLVLGRDYPLPLVDHAEARAKTLERYAVVKGA